LVVRCPVERSSGHHELKAHGAVVELVGFDHHRVVGAVGQDAHNPIIASLSDAVHRFSLGLLGSLALPPSMPHRPGANDSRPVRLLRVLARATRVGSWREMLDLIAEFAFDNGDSATHRRWR
jgi:hypothetical protein